MYLAHALCLRLERFGSDMLIHVAIGSVALKQNKFEDGTTKKFESKLFLYPSKCLLASFACNVEISGKLL